MDTFKDTQIFVQIKEKLEEQHELSKVKSEVARKDLFVKNEARISAIMTNLSQLNRSKSYEQFHLKPEGILE
ncbi:hypothetical protein M9Y10_000469 [Tritrichomonas musculus]|uniref:Uncharacterized protein n=1 Tax=Tritrichomonas musculus TaxID=1915356 RepID=A0ABR2L4A7_9EUKA